ncbi:MAG: hypothetical protein AAFZ52_12490, partial [Bacteroidota bacterium]
MSSRLLHRGVLGLFLLLGISLWLLNWWPARALFLDEANVARNLFDRSFVGLFRPLDHDQYAPPLYLILAKICGELLGYGERSLRLPSLLGGILCIWGLWSAGRSLKLGYWGLLPLALLFVNPLALRYVGELKPYALDMGLAAMLLALALRQKPLGYWWWAGIGAVVVWCSLPAVFVLAAIGAVAWLRARGHDRQQWTGTIVLWLASFGVLYQFVLTPALGVGQLTEYHAQYFFPVPSANGFDLSLALELLKQQVANPFGFTLWASLVGLLGVGMAAYRSRIDQLALLGLPILLVLLVSATGRYSLLPRLLLFSFPGWWLLAARGSKELFTRSNKWVGAGLLIGWLVVLGGTNVVRHYWSPMSFSDSRALVTELREGYRPLLHPKAVPGYDYYQRIHPGICQKNFVTPEVASLRQQAPAGKYVALYDVLTSKLALQQVRRDSLWAATNGAVSVQQDSFFLA